MEEGVLVLIHWEWNVHIHNLLRNFLPSHCISTLQPTLIMEEEELGLSVCFIFDRKRVNVNFVILLFIINQYLY